LIEKKATRTPVIGMVTECPRIHLLYLCIAVNYVLFIFIMPQWSLNKKTVAKYTIRA